MSRRDVDIVIIGAAAASLAAAHHVAAKPVTHLLVEAPVQNRLFFAGEACSVSDYPTAHGAHAPGAAAARATLAALGVA